MCLISEDSHSFLRHVNAIFRTCLQHIPSQTFDRPLYQIVHSIWHCNICRSLCFFIAILFYYTHTLVSQFKTCSNPKNSVQMTMSSLSNTDDMTIALALVFYTILGGLRPFNYHVIRMPRQTSVHNDKEHR